MLTNYSKYFVSIYRNKNTINILDYFSVTKIKIKVRGVFENGHF